MYLLWKKSRQKGLKVAKYSAKVALVKRDVYSQLAPLIACTTSQTVEDLKA